MLYFLPKIQKGLSSVPVGPVISNYGTPTENISEYFDHILKPVVQESWSHIKDSGNKFQMELSWLQQMW